MNRLLRDNLKRLYFSGYKLALRCGFHITPAHYYSPLPNILELAHGDPACWAPPSAMAGIDVNLDAQLANLNACMRPVRA